MRLVQLKVTNFRGFFDETVLDVEDLTAIVGANEAGKSSLLDALAVFFEDEPLEVADVCVRASPREVKIACVFDELPTELVLDRQFKTSLVDEMLIRADGRLEIVKTWNTSTKTPKSVTTIVANHPTANNASDLMTLPNAQLKERFKKLAISDENVDLKVNAQVRHAIRKHVGDLQPTERAIPVDNEVWPQIQNHLPVFAIFRSDRKSSDQDDEAQDPMKAAVKEALATVQPQLDEVAKKVEERVVAVANETLAKLRQNWPDVAGKLHPLLKIGTWDKVFSITLSSDDDVPLNKRGSGVRRLILFSFFRARFEERLRSKTPERSVIYAIEEPETSQHPDNQRRVLDLLAGLSAQPGVQVLFTTHTPTLVASIETGSLRYVTKENDKRVVLSKTDDIFRRVANDLGVLPDHRVKLFLMLEGTHDINFLRRISKILHASDATVPDLQQLETEGLVAPIPLGGSSLKKWVKENYLRELRRKEFHLYDCDDQHAPKYASDASEVNARGDGSFAVLTTKRELESYLHPDAIAAVHPIQIAVGDWTDVPHDVAAALYDSSGGSWSQLADHVRKKKSNAAKSWLNTEAVENMTVERLANRDPNGELKGWLLKIAEMVR